MSHLQALLGPWSPECSEPSWPRLSGRGHSQILWRIPDPVVCVPARWGACTPFQDAAGSPGGVDSCVSFGKNETSPSEVGREGSGQAHLPRDHPQVLGPGMQRL